MKVEALRQVPLFSALPGKELEHLASTLRSSEFPEGATLLREGSADEHFYVLIAGTVEVLKALGTADERVLGTRRAACLLGEMSLFNADGCHTASVRALTPIRVLQVSHAQLDELLHRQPTLAYDLIRLLSNRLQESENATILDLRQKNQQLIVAYRQLEAAQAQLVEKEKMERELEIARQIQLSVLPPALPQQPGFDIAALIHPARAVGGDFYDIIPLGDQRLGIVVGDVCDKGVPAALFMMRCYSLLRAKAGRRRSPAQVLRDVNRHLLNRNPSGMFVTLLYGILDCADGCFTYARAGHPHPIVLDGSALPVAIAGGQGQPLGMWDAPALDEQELVIPEGGLVLVFSDGLSEGIEGMAGACSLEGLCSAVAHEEGATAEVICGRLWQELVASASALQRDDFVVVAIKRNPQ